jgi:hypothetical protein
LVAVHFCPLFLTDHCHISHGSYHGAFIYYHHGNVEKGPGTQQTRESPFPLRSAALQMNLKL